jgi:hypothetical protein
MFGSFRVVAAAAGLTALTVLLASCSSSGAGDGTGGEATAPGGGSAQSSPPAPPNPTGLVDGRVNPALLGTHVGRIVDPASPAPPRAGGIRLWDAGVAWRELEPAQGQVDWALMDAAVSRAQAAGAHEILWVHGSTPAWAAKDPEARGLYGPGTSSAPDEAAYLEILRQIAERYKGRVTAYQAWNEANIKIFYRGTPEYLAELTAKAQRVLDEVDPDALLVGASTTVRAKGPVKDWYDRYAAALAEAQWPVDAMAVHLYPPAEQGAEDRADYVRVMRSWLEARGWTGPLWDTEVNYGDRRDFAKTVVVVPQEQAAAWVARTYLDSLALGVDRVYWYSWNDHLLGIDQVDPVTGATTSAGQAYLTVQDWLADARWDGCSGELVAPTGTGGALTTCSLTTAAGVAAQVVFAHRGSATVELPDGATEICRLDGSCAAVGGASLEVGEAPVLVKLG